MSGSDFCFFFFFSSRRRHTRCGRDWSSDVCSSDLALLTMEAPDVTTHAALLAHHFDEAGERLEAARWHEQAGRRVARSDPAEGARHCRRVTELLAAVPESRETLMLDLT